MSIDLQAFRERKLFHWTLAYLAAAWLVMQVVEVLSSRWAVPLALQRGIDAALVVGFFLALVLAWYHGEKGRQRVSGPELLVLALLLVIGGGMVGMVSRGPDEEMVPDAATAAASARLTEIHAPRLGPSSVAVLPFDDRGAAETEPGLFAGGIHSEILTQLQGLGSLSVVGHTSVLEYVGSTKPPGEIARELGVATLLLGTVFRAGDRFRLNAQLVDGETGRQLWAESFEGELSVAHLFDIQESLALRVAGALDLTLSSTERARLATRPEVSDEAYMHYLSGQSHYRTGRFVQARDAYGLAVSAEPRFGLAWAELARVSALAYLAGAVRDRGESERALDRALELAPRAPETHMAEGAVRTYALSEYDAAIRSFARAWAMRPGAVEPLLYSNFAHTLALRLEEAREVVDRALELDPLNHLALYGAGFVHAALWDFGTARKYYDQAVSIEPDNWYYTYQRLEVYLWGLGDTAMARAIVEENPTPTERAWLAYVSRDTAELAELLSGIDEASTDRYSWMARLHRLRGDTELQRVYGDSMRVTAEEDLARSIEDEVAPAIVERDRSRLAVAHALAGDEDQAIRIIELAVRRVGEQPDRLNAIDTHLREARTYTFLGRLETAVQRLDSLFSWRRSRILTPTRLRLDPDFDALRGHPEFEALLAKYEPLVQH